MQSVHSQLLPAHENFLKASTKKKYKKKSVSQINYLGLSLVARGLTVRGNSDRRKSLYNYIYLKHLLCTYADLKEEPVLWEI